MKEKACPCLPGDWDRAPVRGTMWSNLFIKRMIFLTTSIILFDTSQLFKVLNILRMLQRPLAISLENGKFTFCLCQCMTTWHSLLWHEAHLFPDHRGRQCLPPQGSQSSPNFSSASPPHPLLREVTVSTSKQRQCPILKYLPTLQNKFHYHSYSFDIKCIVCNCIKTPLLWVKKLSFVGLYLTGQIVPVVGVADCIGCPTSRDRATVASTGRGSRMADVSFSGGANTKCIGHLAGVLGWAAAEHFWRYPACTYQWGLCSSLISLWIWPFLQREKNRTQTHQLCEEWPRK